MILGFSRLSNEFGKAQENKKKEKKNAWKKSWYR